MDTEIIPSSLEIKPKRVQNSVKSLFIYSIFMAIGIFLISTREFIQVIIGLISVLYFGIFSLYAIVKAFRRNATITLSVKGLELHKDFGTVLIRWKNIQDIGSCGGYARMVGIKLKSYDEYLAAVPPDQAEKYMERQKVWKVLLYGTYLLTSLIPYPEEERKSMKEYKNVQSMRDILHWTRDAYGYDITLSRAELDRSPDLFLQLLEKYIKVFGDPSTSDDEAI